MDPYNRLGVTPGANQEEIKAAYRKLASKHHPDRGGDTATFQEIQQAYEILTGSRKSENAQPEHNPFGFSWGPGFNPLEEFMRQFHQQNRVYTITIRVTLESVARGSIERVKLNAPNGTITVDIRIPTAIESGQQTQYNGLIPGSPLIVTYIVEPHPIFQRNNLDLVMIKQQNVFDLILGAEIEVADIWGTMLMVNIPPRTQPGTKFRLTGHGLKHNGHSGDLYVLINAVIPDNISEQILDVLVSDRQKSSNGE
jgi:DnaJ-class molecular chaperone